MNRKILIVTVLMTISSSIAYGGNYDWESMSFEDAENAWRYNSGKKSMIDHTMAYLDRMSGIRPSGTLILYREPTLGEARAAADLYLKEQRANLESAKIEIRKSGRDYVDVITKGNNNSMRIPGQISSQREFQFLQAQYNLSLGDGATQDQINRVFSDLKGSDRIVDREIRYSSFRNLADQLHGSSVGSKHDYSIQPDRKTQKTGKRIKFLRLGAGGIFAAGAIGATAIYLKNRGSNSQQNDNRQIDPMNIPLEEVTTGSDQ